ncbi:MAG: adenosylcobinamide-phosphate synthase CbiB [Desulfonauticus sp.]|nr:adenosylcobinamide-phosphate synthase CbiB [Desulfonauticus sp.]
MYSLKLILLWVGLDLIIKDPLCLPHPVQGIGFCLKKIEQLALKSASNLYWMGFVAVVGLSFMVFGLVQFLTSNSLVGEFFLVYLGFAGLAFGSLIRDGQKVAEAIYKGDLNLARKRLGFLVSRDTSKMNWEQVRKALLETMAENFNDGFVAPWFYLLVGGVGWMWVYKTISTFDSMWGYKHGYYQQLGFFAAKSDDFLAYVPARITAFVFGVVGLLVYGKKFSLLQAITDAKKMASPNAGFPIATLAYALDVELGGAAIYFGKKVFKPILGPKGNLPTNEHIKKMFVFLYLSWLLVIGGSVAIGMM